MAKRRLSRHQSWRIEKIQQQRIQRAQKQEQYIDELLHSSALNAEENGTVITQYGQSADIQMANGAITRCFLRQNIGSVVAGDRVIFRQANGSDGVIVANRQRHSELVRPDKYGKIKAIAANIDHIFIVFATEPEAQEILIDRYLVAAELQGIRPSLVFNKIDLLTPHARADYLTRFSHYQNMGYPLIEASTHSQYGLNALCHALKDANSVFVGQSGVGKSSLVNMLLESNSARVANISEANHKGRHTTTAATLYHCPTGGHIIDSPGIREFGLWHIEPERLIDGFIDFQPFIGHCQFRNCTHDNEKGCALTAAVKQGKILPLRLANYHRIMKTIVESSHLANSAQKPSH
ncbi:Putative ribosome biogenesis GTPase RsgA [Piscirickettsia salmonis]|uniref:small ribosomal subunit biogenesis GTPase RsgA n=1 Tax=Piscirickettsia salmonis TaxID=1238 RepID=UPI0012B85DD3|nr:small ribosomal subunit biogenesis GTPase RsgA [Piscirickettsia salmonis]QGP50508.1 Putative ribosome biogenesis GTPase RsgA [Piscirickettsia salmonis]